MTRRSQLLILSTVALAGAVLVWLGTGKSTPVPAGDAAVEGTPTFSVEKPAHRNADALSPERKDLSPATNRRDPRVAKVLESMAQGQTRGKISRDALEAFLEKRGRTSRALLAVWQESGDPAYLREALDITPDEPEVLLAAALEPTMGDPLAFLARMMAAAPRNPLPSWLAASAHFKTGNQQAAFAEILAAEGRDIYDNHQAELLAERQALFEAAGFEPLRAELEATFGLRLAYHAPLREATNAVKAALPELRAGGQQAMAQDLAATAVNLGRTMNREDGLLIDQLVGIALEKSTLTALGDSANEILGGTISAARLAELEQQTQQIRELTKNADLLQSNVSYDQLREYLRLMRNEGEQTALRWLNSQKAAR